MRRGAVAGAGLLAAGIGALALRVAHHQEALSVEVPAAARRTTEYVGSDACRRCHEDHHESWARTFHRTMTQALEGIGARGEGAFDGSTLRYLGWTATMTREGDQRWVMLRSPAGEEERHEVVRAVGSRRVQQYFTKRGDSWWRLPVAWNIEERRWMHMNGAFLTPDPGCDGSPAPCGDGPATRRDYERHVTRWNDNCVFCHNVAPNPGRDEDGAFETEVAELGVACEACHGPGADHVAANTDPVRRYVLHLGDASDPSVTNPAELSPARSGDVCGRCHGQRKTDDIAAVLAEGDDFVPGEDLAVHSEPLCRDTTIDGRPIFTTRFWPDGTPRLTAYEYQGWLQSACTTESDLTCTHCHGMHEGDPRGQLREEARTDAVCTSCHQESLSGEAHTQHVGHVDCVDCHMPRVVYGIVTAHRSHRIEIPDPTDTTRPDACTLCHVGRTRAWVLGDEDDGASEVARRLFAGDPIERALAADALGQPTAVLEPAGDPDVRGLLLAAMRSDPYPAVRRIAWRSWLRRTGRPPTDGRYDPTADRTTRAAVVADLWTDETAPDPAWVAARRAEARWQTISIGE